MDLVIGVEGGTTATKAIILDKSGHIISYVVGPHTNINLLGVVELSRRIQELLIDCLKIGKLPIDSRINYLGLSLSGIDTVDLEVSCRDAMKETWKPGIDHIFVCNDTVGALRTAADAGIILISGTGSNCRLIHKDLSFDCVGGWGHLLGDEGSAFNMIHVGIKRAIDDEEGRIPSSAPCDVFKSIVLNYFKIPSIYDLIPMYYLNFDKARIANMCPLIAKAAESGDQFSVDLFYEAGFKLGRMVATMARKCEKSILEKPEGLSVVCVGGVWNSWSLLKSGFLDGLKPKYDNDITINKVCLKKLKVTAAYGTAIIASELGNSPIIPDYSSTFSVFYQS